MKNENPSAKAQLLKMLKPGDTIYSIIRHVSSSGMSRNISFFVLKRDKNGCSPLCLDWRISEILGYRQAKRDGLTITGYGMDMGFHVVYNLGRALWPNGTPKPHGTRNGEPDRDGGFALNHRWL